MTLKKGILSLSIVATAAVAYVTTSAYTPVRPVSEPAASIVTPVSGVDAYIADLYNQIDFTGDAPLNPELFHKAMVGYLNLRNAGKLGSNQNTLSVCDFTLSSKQRRLWIIDLASKKVLFNELVAHGQGSGDEFATAFSDLENSHQTSLGFYVTGETYTGGHGLSLRLNGMDAGFNASALRRGVVVHGAPYVCDGFVAGQNRLGRSWGCPAVADAKAPAIIRTIRGGSCLFIYAADKKYAKASVWMNRDVQMLPDGLVPATRLATATPVRSKTDSAADGTPAVASHASTLL